MAEEKKPGGTEPIYIDFSPMSMKQSYRTRCKHHLASVHPVRAYWHREPELLERPPQSPGPWRMVGLALLIAVGLALFGQMVTADPAGTAGDGMVYEP